LAIDEETLAQDSRPLAQWDADFARMIDRIFRGGARAVAIDLLLPGNWSRSAEFGATVAAQADHLALAKLSATSGSVIGPECISPLVAYRIGKERLAAAFGFANLDPDPDGGIRRARLVYVDRDGREQPSFAARAVLAMAPNSRPSDPANRRAWIDYSTRPGDIPKLSWKDVAGQLKDSPAIFENRLVIIGAEYGASDDEHLVPASASPTPVSSAVIQALIANTVLGGFRVRDWSLSRSMLVIAIVCVVIFLTALRFPHRPMLASLVAGVCLCGYGLCAFAIFRWSRIMIAVIGPELAIVLSAASAWVLKSRMKPYPIA
jgi:CHASE2 domain-containing sensor protein